MLSNDVYDVRTIRFDFVGFSVYVVTAREGFEEKQGSPNMFIEGLLRTGTDDPKNDVSHTVYDIRLQVLATVDSADLTRRDGRTGWIKETAYLLTALCAAGSCGVSVHTIMHFNGHMIAIGNLHSVR